MVQFLFDIKDEVQLTVRLIFHALYPSLLRIQNSSGTCGFIFQSLWSDLCFGMMEVG